MDSVELVESTGPSNFRFYYVSRKRFVVLSLLTLGLFEIYWFYRNWKLIKQEYQLKITPLARAIFAIFFVHDLFKRIFLAAQTKGYESKINPGSLATGWILLTLLANAANRIPAHFVWGWAIWLVGLTSFLCILPILDAIEYFNLNQGFDLNRDKKITVGQTILIIIGVLLWFLALLGMFASTQPQAIS